jgi:hypothetical protein
VKLEIQYAKEILESKFPCDVLEKFTFYKNYLRLVRIEYGVFELKPGDSIVFIGSWLLPLTFIVFFKHYRIRSIGVEQDPARADHSIETLRKLGLSKNMKLAD